MRLFFTSKRAGLIGRALLAAGVGLLLCGSARAAVIVSEVAPWSSGNSSLEADWFELTNTGAAAVNISGWKFDDSSASFASSVALNGITNIAAGESVVFIESAAPATIVPAFKSLWFGANPPAGLQVGTYTGSGIGLSTSNDAVNIFNGSGVVQANVSFGSSPAGPTSFATFDNAAGLTGPISQLSAAGVNGAFAVVNNLAVQEIGSPGKIANVPEPASLLLLIAGTAATLAFRRRQA